MAQDLKNQRCCQELCSDFAFAFDDPAFSDRILKLMIYDDLLEAKNDSESAEGCKLNDLLSSLKRRKEDIPESDKEVRVKSLQINSLILAAKSPFFRKLFTNGMKASNEHEVILRIHSSEEDPIVDVLKFMYNKNLLSANAPNALMEVLVAADKYDVLSCVNYCCRLLLSFPMTGELALFYIDLPSVISIDTIQPLVNAAQAFLPNIVKNITKYREDIINLSVNGIKAILSRYDLTVNSEDEAYDLLVEWSKEHFLDSEERCRFLNTEVFNLLHLQHMTSEKLKEMLVELSSGNSLDLATVTSVMEAVFNQSNSSLPRKHRAYKMFPIAITTFEFPVKQCVIFFDLKAEQCRDTCVLSSKTFILDENVFYLTVQTMANQTCNLRLHLKAKKKQSGLKVAFGVDTRQKSSSPQLFETKRRPVTYTFSAPNGVTSIDNIGTDTSSYSSFSYFIDGTLHLRAYITIIE